MAAAMDDLGAGPSVQPKPSKMRQYEKIPIYVVEYHNEALPFIYRNIGSKYLPLKGTTMVHFDSHPDLLVPKNLPADTVYSKYELFHALSIENWIIPAVYGGHFGKILWAKPPWALQMSEGVKKFVVGKDVKTGTIRTNSTENYFISECLYSPKEDLENIKDLELEVMTVGKDFDGKRRIEVNGDYILDVDLDFFSTSNPFKEFYSESNLYEKLKVIYNFEVPGSVDEIPGVVKRREEQINSLEKIFKYLQDKRSMPPVDETSKVFYEKVADLKSHMFKFYKDEHVDWELVHDAGCTCDDSELPHHVSTPEEIEDMLKAFNRFLEALPAPPTIITISRSTEDNYTPCDVVEMLQNRVIESLSGKFKCDEAVLDYLSKPSSDEEK